MNQALKRFNIENVNLLVKEFINMVDNLPPNLGKTGIIIDDWIKDKIEYQSHDGIIKDEFFYIRLIRNFFLRLSNQEYFNDVEL